MSAEQPPNAKPSGLPPVSAAVRQRLQAVFDHGRKCMEKGDHDYAHDLFTQCVAEDPAILIYLQHLLGNLSAKFGDAKKGARLSALKIKSARMSLTKSAAKANWHEAFQAGCDALKLNPWDTSTLLAFSDACAEVGGDQCQLYLLRWALDVAPKDVQVNRRAAQALSKMGQFDQAIACWRRVEQAKPRDQEAAHAISTLSVERTIQQGGYNQELLGGGQVDLSELEAEVRARGTDGQTPPADAREAAQHVREETLLAAVEADPAGLGPYLELADLFTQQKRLREAEQLLTRAHSASGGGDLTVREALEDAQLRRVHQQLAIAQRRAEKQGTEEAADLARRMAIHANQAELEVYVSRAEREPGNRLLQYELGLRLKRAGRFKEAIGAFQAAREEPRHKAQVQLHLGECFQHVHQFKLALTSYEAAVEAADVREDETHKLALYRAGVLAAELKEIAQAERHLTSLAAIDFGYRDVADRLDKLAALRDTV